MNKITAHVISISSVDILHLLSLKVDGDSLKVLTLELPHGLQVDSEVELLIKPTNMVISKDRLTTITSQNQLTCKIIKIERGEILVHTLLEYNNRLLEALIPRCSWDNLAFVKGDEVSVHLLESAISLGECRC